MYSKSFHNSNNRNRRSQLLSSYESHIWALINSSPDMTASSNAVSASKTISRPNGPNFMISYKSRGCLPSPEGLPLGPPDTGRALRGGH